MGRRNGSRDAGPTGRRPVTAPFAGRVPIEPPPGPVDERVRDACTYLRRIHSRAGAVATMTEPEYDAWRNAVRYHRDAWTRHLAATNARAQQALDIARKAYDAAQAQGRAVGWWNDNHPDMVTPTVPIIDPPDAARSLVDTAGQRDGETWSWQLHREVRNIRKNAR